MHGYSLLDTRLQPLLHAVAGERADPLWRWLTTEGPFPGEVGWNFDAIFLVDAAGVPVGRRGSHGQHWPGSA